MSYYCRLSPLITRLLQKLKEKAPAPDENQPQISLASNVSTVRSHAPVVHSPTTATAPERATQQPIEKHAPAVAAAAPEPTAAATKARVRRQERAAAVTAAAAEAAAEKAAAAEADEKRILKPLDLAAFLNVSHFADCVCV